MSTTTETAERTAKERSEPFHITCKTEQDSPTMWVGICVNEALTTYLVDKKITDPQIVLVVRQGSWEQRLVAPLSRGVVHLALPRAGSFTLKLGVACSKQTSFMMKRVLLGRDEYDNYKRNLFDYGGEQFRGSISAEVMKEATTVEFYPHTATQEVIVAANNFAPEPAKWRKAFVGMIFNPKVRDQCSFRRKNIMAVPLALLVPLHYAAKLVGMALCTALGLVYRSGFKNAWKPGRYGGFGDVFGSIKFKRSAWFYQSSKQNYKPRSAAFVAALVSSWLFIAGTVIRALAADESLLMSIWFVLRIAIGFGIAIALIAGFITVLDKTRNGRTESRAARRSRRRQDDLLLLQQNLNELTCERAGRPLTVGDILQKRKTSPVVLYNRLKDKVCKPFAR